MHTPMGMGHELDPRFYPFIDDENFLNFNNITPGNYSMPGAGPGVGMMQNDSYQIEMPGGQN